MSLRREYEDPSYFDFNYDDASEISHKKRVKKLLEDRLERRRLKEDLMDEFEEFDDEFDWNEVVR